MAKKLPNHGRISGGTAVHPDGPRERKLREKPYSHPDRKWEVRDAMDTMLRAREIVGNKPLLKEVRKHAKQHSTEMAEVSRQAGELAKRGMISPKAMERINRRRA